MEGYIFFHDICCFPFSDQDEFMGQYCSKDPTAYKLKRIQSAQVHNVSERVRDFDIKLFTLYFLDSDLVSWKTVFRKMILFINSLSDWTSNFKGNL